MEVDGMEAAVIAGKKQRAESVHRNSAPLEGDLIDIPAGKKRLSRNRRLVHDGFRGVKLRENVRPGMALVKFGKVNVK
jgi:hypothetical protein